MFKKAALYFFMVLAGAAILYFLISRKGNHKEGFASNYNALSDEIYKVYNRNDYIAASDNKYNKFASMIDVRNLPFYGSWSDNAREVNKQGMKDATYTSDPNGSTPGGPFSIEQVVPRLDPPKRNTLIVEALKCEAAKSRNTCKMLDDPGFKNCGICIKNGDAITYDNKNHIGGMLALTTDIQEQKDAALNGEAVAYQPTAGKCPMGNFYVDRAQCEKAVNRIECKEIGETGGWSGTTVEGNKFADLKCAQVTKGDGTTFIYDPKNRSFNMVLRVLAPSGTGLCKVWVNDAEGTKQLGFAEGQPGTEFLVTVGSVAEGQTVQVVVAQEFPYRLHGKPELFGVENGGYNQTKESATALCQRMGTQLATMAQMTDAIQNGAQVCMSGWGQDFCGYPGQASLANSGGCGGKGFNNWCYTNPSNSVTVAATYCYGIKPAKSKNQIMPVNIADWFGTFGKNAIPSQEDQPTLWSRHGADYQAPCIRAVLLQWEIDTTNPVNLYTTRTINFEPTIIRINDQEPNNVSSDGTKTFKVLRRFGTFGASKDIVSPRPTVNDKMLTNQFWIWGNMENSQQVKFTCVIPSIFLPSYYPEDRAVSNDGPLIAKSSSLSALRSSPCFNADQKPGNYSISCLKNLFVGAGGDITNGKMATTGLGLSQLNAKGDIDAISDYLTDLYDQATTGKDSDGNKLGSTPDEHKKMINNASQLLFGFDLCTPCEDIGEDKNGDIIFTPKNGNLDAYCLDWLWTNTGRSKDQFEDFFSGARIRPTYTTIGQRFSGLKEGEASDATREKFPFQTCQRSGSKAPIDTKGSINMLNVAEANTHGSVANVQAWYDNMYQTANKPVYTKGQAQTQSDAVSQCYGVNKIKDKVCQATFYRDYNYGGPGVTLDEGEYPFSRLMASGVPNDWASSVRVSEGCKVQVFEHDLDQGRSATLTQDSPSLDMIGNDTLSSCRILKA